MSDSDNDESKKNSSFKTDTSHLTDEDSVDSDTNKKNEEEIKEPELDAEEKAKRDAMKDFENYLIKVLDDSIVKKSEIKTLNYESWFVENKQRHAIKVRYRLDGKPHEITIEDTKYFVKELFIWSGIKTKYTAKVWDLHVGSKIDIFGKPTILKQWCLKTTEWNNFYGAFLKEIKKTFVDEIKKYERKKLDVKLVKDADGKQKGSIDLALLIKQVSGLKEKMSKYRPMLSDDIMIAFESLL